MVSVPNVALAGNEMVPVEFWMLRPLASIAPENVAPPVLAKVRVFSLVMAPETRRTPVVLMERLWLPFPVIWEMVMAPIPVLSVVLAIKVVAASFRLLLVVESEPPN